MRLPKKKARIVLQAIDALRQENVIDEATAGRIRGGIEPIAFDWRRLARYSFIAAMACVAISIGAVFFDDAILQLIDRIAPLLRRLWQAPPLVHCLTLATISGLIVWLGLKRRTQAPDKIYSTETVFVAAAAGMAGASYFLGESLGWREPVFVNSFVGLVFLAFGGFVGSKAIWAFGLIAISAALGSGTGYEWGGYFLDLEHPLMSLVYGAALTLGAEAIPGVGRYVNTDGARLLRLVEPFAGVTRVIGLLHWFVALWILSIWGHEGWSAYNGDSFRMELIWWSFLFLFTAATAVARALQKDDAVLRGFGLTFFFIGLYTKFFEYFWTGLHKAVFFAILGASFWLIGRKAEAMWRFKLPHKSVESVE